MSTSPTTTAEISIWAGCLHCYVAGDLVGEWFDAHEADDITPADVHGHPVDETHDEIWVFDHEGFPAGTGEMGLHDAQQWADVLTEVDDRERPALLAWVESGYHVTEDDSDLPSVSEFRERYCGLWENFGDYASELARETGVFDAVPDNIRCYIDENAWTRDLSYDYATEPAAGHGVYIFRCL